ncbi:MAG: hypothetical protein K9I34_00865 [Bacteroidales bacterium]|nr:hypothetical protein [Bacteroidales bacterium]
MRTLILIVGVLLSSYSFGQTKLDKSGLERKGFVFGLGIGAGVLNLSTNDTLSVSLSATLPNIKVGYMINNRLALVALLPGANYKYNGNDRGFEGFILAGQYWLKDKWWVLAGTGLTFDAAAFYTVKDPGTAGFYTGIPAFSLATGYEIWHKGSFVLDLQYRVFLGKSNLPNDGYRKGISNMLTVGFNWE